jgi:hypothetical protein
MVLKKGFGISGCILAGMLLGSVLTSEITRGKGFDVEALHEKFNWIFKVGSTVWLVALHNRLDIS